MSRTANNSISGQGKPCLYGTMKVTYKRCHGNAEQMALHYDIKEQVSSKRSTHS